MDRRKSFRAIVLHAWPGVAALWTSGSVRGLTIAVIFGVLLQFAVAVAIVWPAWIGPISRTVVWFCVLGFWLLFAAEGFCRALGCLKAAESGIDLEHLFQTAQREYLKGEWHEAERLLRQILAVKTSDVDARLLLAMVYRHGDKIAAARKQLRQLSAMEGAAKWQFEVRGEEHLIRQRDRQLRRARQRGNRAGVEAA